MPQLLQHLSGPDIKARAVAGAALTLVAGAHAALVAWLAMAPAPPTPVQPGVVITASLRQAAPAPTQPLAEPPPPPEAPAPEPVPEASPLLSRTEPAPLETTPPPPEKPPPKKPEPKKPIPARTPPPASLPAVADTPVASPAPESAVAAETVSAPQFDAAYLENPAPSYPAISRRMREEGTVLLRVLVDRGGRAGEVRVDASSGSSRLDRAAVEAVRRWRFVPAHRGGEPVAGWVVVPIAFSLRG